ncbi:taurine ABC transporter substrate-binding protein [Crenobacter cavernae]|uniref:Taurine ABC transporter substrate-binding protein n=1 Tax=Crenobacter cavernae TaxID=2290923 RepID=A0ABY0F9R3_9NEIS|nr:taurine ABC transporter substrate-binding protein [Crenobacter cavernae]RXZ41997.1 taurine ABC transporter substrate-binding protein [Crenobacter cavernae]
MNSARFLKKVLTLSATLSALTASGLANAEQKEVTIAYQQIAGPLLTVIANGAAEKATGYKIHWRQFESGAKVSTAMASGDVQLGVIGSSPLTAAVSRGVPLQLFWILDDINEAEAMVVRNGSGINKPADLKGKKLGVPFVSTTHFHTMYALSQWGIKPGELEILNMQPNQIAAAWGRGDIDAAYVWDPALARIKQTGKVLITSGQLSKKGSATFDGMAVSRPWAEANPAFMASFTKVVADADAAYRAQAWGPDSAQVKTMSKMLGGDPKDVANAVKLYAYPSIEQQISPAWLGGKNGGAVRALKATADFLKSQKRIDALAPDYGAFVTPKYAEAALKLKK